MKKAGEIIAHLTTLKGNLEGIKEYMDSLDADELENLTLFCSSLSELCNIRLGRMLNERDEIR